MLTVRAFEESLAVEWDRFVLGEARNATFLHTRAFFRHDPRNAEDDASLMFYKGGRLVGVLPAALLQQSSARVLNSHPRATYGGFVVAPQVGISETLEMVDLTIERARSLAVDEIAVRNPFRIFHRVPSDESDYCMWLRGFAIKSREAEVAIQLDGLTTAGAVDTETILRVFESKTRNQVRKAISSGVVVAPSEAYDQFWDILEENLRERHGTKPTHSREGIHRLRNLVGAEKVQLLAAHHDGHMIAGLLLFAANPRAVHTQYIASRHEASHLCPVNLLIMDAIRWALARGALYLNLGTSTEDAGRTVNHGLFKFKEGFGGRSILRETMTLALSRA